MAADPTSAQFRASEPVARAPRPRIQSTNCAVQSRHGEGGRQSRAGSLVEAIANVAAGFLVALLGQQVILPLFDIHVGLAVHAGIAAVFTLLSLMRSYVLRRLFDHLAWQRREEQQLQRERLARRLVGGPS